MFLPSFSLNRHLTAGGISLADLLDDRCGHHLSDYLALSVTRVGENIVISLTTTDDDPVTYSAVVLANASVEPASLVFVAQHDRCKG